MKSTLITNTPEAKGFLKNWDKTVSDANSFFFWNPYNYYENSHEGKATLADAKHILETVLQLRVTEAIQKHPEMPQAVIESIVALGCESLDRISEEVLTPKVGRSATVKGLIKEANTKMQEVMGNLEDISESTERWDSLIMKANQGKNLEGQEDSKYMIMAERAFFSCLDILSEQVTKDSSVPKGTFLAAIDGAWDEVVQTHKEMLNGTNVTSRTKIRCLDGIMSKKLFSIREMFVKGDVHKPSTVPELLELNDQGYVIIRPAKIENIVLQGGGAKGLGYVGALGKMVKGGVLSDLKRVAGSSAGALTAAALGCGIPVDKLEVVGERIQKVASSGAAENINRDYPGLKNMFIWGISFFGRAEGVVKEIDKITHESVKDFLDNVFEDDLAGLTQQELERITLLKEPYEARVRMPDENSVASCPMVTFADLIMLRKLPGGSELFKEVTMTGWNATDKKTEYFDCKRTPNMPIALGARVSMSLPFGFNGIQLDLGRYSSSPTAIPQKVNMYDGGVGSNLPTEIFIKNDGSQSEREREEAQAKTLSFVFDNQGKSFSSLSRYKGFGCSFSNKLISILLGVFSITGLFSNTYEDLVKAEAEKKNALGNMIVVSHGDVETTDISLDESIRRSVTLMSELGTTQWVEQHRNEGYYMNCTSIQEAAGMLSVEELVAVIDELEAKSEEQRTPTDSRFLIACQEALEVRTNA